jgi:hypothetical protein
MEWFNHLKTGHDLCLENDYLNSILSGFQMVTVQWTSENWTSQVFRP